MWSLLLRPNVLIAGTVMLVLGMLFGGHKLAVRSAISKAVLTAQAEMSLDYSKKLLEASELAREREAVMVSSVNTIRKDKDAKIKALDAHYAVALGRLSERPPRTPSTPSDTKAPSPSAGATGSSLSREDSGFLIGEAARADALRTALDQCYRQYDSVRNSMK